MSWDNTSHPGSRRLDELVPSRYALRVGEIDALAVSDGVVSLPIRMLAHDTDPAVRAAWLRDMSLPPEMLDWPLNEVVVRSGDRTILVGGNTDDARLGRMDLANGSAAHSPQVDPVSLSRSLA